MQKKDALVIEALDVATIIRMYEVNCQGPDIEEEEREVINYVFAKAPHGVSKEAFDSEYVVVTDITSIDQRFMLTLCPGSLIHGDIIDNVAHLVNSRQIIEAFAERAVYLVDTLPNEERD